MTTEYTIGPPPQPAPNYYQLPGGRRLAYIVTGEAWYARSAANHAEIVIQAHPVDDDNYRGRAWDIVVSDVSKTIGRPTIEVTVYNEAFDAFVEAPELFRRLRGAETLDGVRDVLDSLGAVDRTDRADPHAASAQRDPLNRLRAYLSSVATAVQSDEVAVHGGIAGTDLTYGDLAALAKRLDEAGRR